MIDKTTSVVAIGHICYVMMVVFVCIKQLPIVNVAICMNMGPILTVFLAAVLNKEKITWVVIIHVFMAFVGVILIVVGSSSYDDSVTKESNIIYYLLMVSAPVAIGFGNLRVSKISQHPNILSFFLPWWVSLASTVVFGLICLIMQVDLPSQATFWWLSFFVSGLSGTFSISLKILAFKHDKVSRVSPIFYLESVFGLFLDYFCFGIAFGALQFTGICLVFCMFGWKIAQALQE